MRSSLYATLVACGLLLMPGGTALSTSRSTAGAVQSVDVRLQVAIQKLESGDTIGALLDLESLLSRQDTYWPAYYWRGRVQSEMGDDLGAKESFLRAADLDPGNPELHFLAASVSWQLADFTAAWAHTIAAAQAGYPDDPVRQLMSNLRGYADAPEDLEERLRAPRVAVSNIATADVSPDLILGLRTRLARSRNIALVQAEGLAAYLVVITPDPEAGEEAWRFEIVMSRASDGEQALRAPLDAREGGIPSLEAAVSAIEELVGRGPGA